MSVNSEVIKVHLANARRAARRWGVDVDDILGILDVEGGTSPSGAPVRPGDGAGPPSYGQFTFGTGSSLGVKFGSSASETDAIARYLVSLGYKHDRKRAIASYNGGPGNPQYDYAQMVIDKSNEYRQKLGSLPPGLAGAGAGAADPGLTGAAGGGLFSSEQRSGAVKALLWVSFVLGGFWIAGMGVSRMTGAGSAA